MDNGNILKINKSAWVNYYSGPDQTREFPDDYIVRFYNRYLKKNIQPDGRVLDFGFGLGNNSLYFMKQKLDVYGIDIADSLIPSLRKSLKRAHCDASTADKFKIVKDNYKRLPYKSGYFDFILANNVLYYYPSEKYIKEKCEELSRCLRPGGIVLFTMCGPYNSIMKHTKQIRGTNLYQVSTEGKKFSVDNQIIYLVKSERHLKRLFSGFEPIDAGYHDEFLFGRRDFSWIFIGRKAVKKNRKMIL